MPRSGYIKMYFVKPVAMSKTIITVTRTGKMGFSSCKSNIVYFYESPCIQVYNLFYKNSFMRTAMGLRPSKI